MASLLPWSARQNGFTSWLLNRFSELKVRSSMEENPTSVMTIHPECLNFSFDNPSRKSWRHFTRKKEMSASSFQEVTSQKNHNRLRLLGTVNDRTKTKKKNLNRKKRKVLFDVKWRQTTMEQKQSTPSSSSGKIIS